MKTRKPINRIRIPDFDAMRREDDRYWAAAARKRNRTLWIIVIITVIGYVWMFLDGGFKNL